MTDSNTPKATDGSKPPSADRIAKVMARAGIASRRESERMILEGRVTVNGQKIDSPAMDVQPSDKITVDGKRLEEPQETRLWLYYKPLGLVTSESDEKGRQTVFDALPRDLPRVMTVGRLDLNSEGLLLLTNDGELKRSLELPSTGWLRRYRVRVNGTPNDLTFAPLRRGATIDGEEFAPMEIRLDSQQGANAWLTVGIREGKNREIRRAMSHIGLQVNRLIRVGYGPFRLTGLEKNQVVEVKRRALRDQLGGMLTGETEPKEREMRPRGAETRTRGGDMQRKPRGKPGFGDERRGDRPERSGDAEGIPPRKFGTAARTRTEDGPVRDGKPWAKRDRPEGQRSRDERPQRSGDADGRSPRKFGTSARTRSDDGQARDNKPWVKKDRPDGPRSRDGVAGEKPRRSFGAKPDGGRPARDFSGKPDFKGGRGPAKGPAKPGTGGRSAGGKPFAGKPAGGKPGGGRPSGKPRGSRN